MSTARVWLVALIVLGLCGGIADAYLYYAGAWHVSLVGGVWQVAWLVLLVLWIDADSRHRADIYRPYDLGFFILLVWPAYVPYYFLRTRGWRGALWLMSAFVLLFLGTLLKIAVMLGFGAAE